VPRRVVAHAHARGGGELGTAWYHAGRRARKPGTLADAAAAARLLVGVGLTRAALLASATESAGGLVGGWLAVARPGLLAAHVAAAPLLDVAATMADARGALTPAEYGEWGDPRTDPAVARAMAGYCPTAGAAAAGAAGGGGAGFPSVLLACAAADARVPAVQALRFLARVREGVRAAGAPPPRHPPLLLCHVERGAGHAGSADAPARADAAGLQLAFLYAALGLDLDAATTLV
jgi:oligopeptidase B